MGDAASNDAAPYTLLSSARLYAVATAGAAPLPPPGALPGTSSASRPKAVSIPPPPPPPPPPPGAARMAPPP